MTLGDFFDILSQNPAIVYFYFMALPLTALLAGIFGKGEGEITPWKYLYSILVFLAAIPGIFAITLNVYLFMFERQSIMDTQMATQIVPVLSMMLTFYLIRRNVCLDDIPGFDKISGLVMILTALISLMWIAEKTHIIAITFLPFTWVLGIFAILLFLIRFGWKKFLS